MIESLFYHFIRIRPISPNTHPVLGEKSFCTHASTIPSSRLHMIEEGWSLLYRPHLHQSLIHQQIEASFRALSRAGLKLMRACLCLKTHRSSLEHIPNFYPQPEFQTCLLLSEEERRRRKVQTSTRFLHRLWLFPKSQDSHAQSLYRLCGRECSIVANLHWSDATRI